MKYNTPHYQGIAGITGQQNYFAVEQHYVKNSHNMELTTKRYPNAFHDTTPLKTKHSNHSKVTFKLNFNFERHLKKFHDYKPI